jgi:hypothetical protein
VLNSSTGELAGTPSTPGDYSFTVAVNDASARTVSKAFTLTVLPPGLAITSAPALPAATFGQAYNFTFQADGGTTPYRWTLSSGNLPAGLTLSNAGVIGGTPSAIGSSTVNITVLDAAGRTNSRDFTLAVNAPGLPSFSITGPADTVDPATQARLALELGAAYPSRLSGTIVITFIADTVNSPAAPSEDPRCNLPMARACELRYPASATTAEFEGTPRYKPERWRAIVLTPSFTTLRNCTRTAPRTIRILRAAPRCVSAVTRRRTVRCDDRRLLDAA